MLTVLRYPTKLPFTSACRAATGRSAVYHMARQWVGSHVFMPGYVPDGIIDPFVEAGLTVTFYKLTEKMYPNLLDLAAKLERAKAEKPIIVLIHYFGMQMPTGGCRELADRFDGIFFEDLAHCVMGSPRGLTADVVLYSLNKFLAVCDGAIIASRREDLDLSNGVIGGELPAEVVREYKRHLALTYMVTGAKPDKDVSDLLLESAQRYDNYYRFISKDVSTLRLQSAESRATEAATDFRSMYHIRRSQASILADHLPMDMLLDDVAEFAFPIRCLGHREEMVSALHNAGVIASALTDRWDHIPRNDGFDLELRFMDDHLLLPLGEPKIDDLLLMANVLSGFR